MTTITIDRATVEQALEAMKRGVPTGKITLYEWDKAMAALRAALARQAKPVEPVAWVNVNHLQGLTLGLYGYVEIYTDESHGRIPLYTAPPQRKPLTEEEIERICMTYQSPRQAARAVERAHNITDPQVADRLARHGIPMPEGDPK